MSDGKLGLVGEEGNEMGRDRERTIEFSIFFLVFIMLIVQLNLVGGQCIIESMRK